MTDETGSTAGEAIALPADAPEAFDSPNAAAEYLTSLLSKPEEPAESAEAPEPATAETESPERDDSDPETDPAEPEEAEPEALPPIERPRSWAKELDEEWASYPREAQEKIAKREQERDTAIRRGQNEAAEARKAADAAREAAEKAKQQYEAQLPQLVQELQNVSQASFSDIKTMDDVAKLQAEDPFRFQAFQVHQMRLQAAKQESDRVQGEQAQAKQAKRANYENEQNKLLFELVPEMADAKKASELRERAVKMLIDDLGMKDDQLSRWYADDTGHEILSNAGIQKLIADGLKYRDILNAPKPIAARTLPPVQRPGTAKPAGSVNSERIQALSRKSELTESEATELYLLQQSRPRPAS